jgi:hypothetical protein
MSESVGETMPDSRLDDLFGALEIEAERRRLPPVDRWVPVSEGSIDVRIGRDGTWYHEGTAFQRPALVRLLSTVLRREGDKYFLTSPHEKLRITVEDVPLLALDFESRGEGEGAELLFTTNGGDHVVADAVHPVFMRNDRPYLHVRDGLEALIVRSAFYRMVDRAGEKEGRPCIYSRGAAFFLG